MTAIPSLETPLLACEADPLAWLRKLADTAVAAVHPDALLEGQLPEPPAGRTLVVGAGKAAAAMAAALGRA